jgi:hypothetical protein
MVFILIFLIASPTVLSAAKGPTVADLQKKITVLSRQVKDLKTKLSLKTKESEKYKKEITTYKNNNDSLKIENVSLRKQKIELESLIESDYEKITQLNGYLEEKDKNVNRLEKLLNAKVIYTDNNINVITENNPNAIKWYGFETQQATIYFTRKAFEAYWYIVDISDEVLADTASYFNMKNSPKKIPVFISFNEPIRDIEFAQYPSDEDKIFIIGSKFVPYNKNNNEGIIQVYTHEFTHAFQDNLKIFSNGQFDFDDEKRWLYEGMAAYLSRQHMDYTQYNIPNDHLGEFRYGVERYKNMILNAIYYNKEVNLSTITTMINSTNNYTFYESVIYYMHEKYGKEKVNRFIDEFKNKTLSNALMESYGVTEEQFMSQWKKFYKL